jgi:hypothetical protein
MVGLARSIEMLSSHAAVFGVAMTIGTGLMLVSLVSRSAVGGWMAPGGGANGTSGVASGKLAALVSAFPGADVHELPGAEAPGRDALAVVPVVLPATEPRMRTGIAGASTAGGGVVLELMGRAGKPGIAVARFVLTGLIEVVGLEETRVVVDVTLITDGESSATNGEQLTVVPGIVGSCANGDAAKVVAGAPGTVAAEKRLVNGPGPVSGDDTIAPGVVGSPIEVVPIVDICARQPPQLSKSIAITQGKLRMSNWLPVRHEFASSGCGATLLPSARSTIGLRTTRSPGLRPC